MRQEIVAILIDGGFYQRRAKALFGVKTASERANELERYCYVHLEENLSPYSTVVHVDHLYRIFYYDCPPAENQVYHPWLKRTINLKGTELYTFMTAFHEELRAKRKFALRLGKLSSNDLQYSLNLKAQKKLLRGEITIQDLTEQDFSLQIGQKGVDMRIGLDISSMAYKKQVTRIILISGDSDFVPAAKLARREGIDFVLDPMGARISHDLLEHIDGIRSNIPQFRDQIEQIESGME